MDRRRIAAQPVSWGINYLPGWGRQLAAAEIVADVRRLGLSAMEYQPGLFPEEPEAASAFFEKAGIRPVAGWVPVVLQVRDRSQQLESFRKSVGFLSSIGASIATIGTAAGDGSFDRSVELDADDWRHLLQGLDEISEIAEEAGVRIALHPHIGTAVERGEAIERVLNGSRVGFCYDAGHIACAGDDPVALARLMAPRVTHVHLKDINLALARRLIAGEIAWAEAVGKGLFTPLGAGDLDLPAILSAFDRYDGYIVIEQDIRLPDGDGWSASIRMRRGRQSR